jgi:hypothetical protein
MPDENDDMFDRACVQFFDAVGYLAFSRDDAITHFGSVSSGVAWELHHDIQQYGKGLLHGFRHRLTAEEIKELLWFVSNLEKSKKDLLDVVDLYEDDKNLCDPWARVKADSNFLTTTFHKKIASLTLRLGLSSNWGARLGV